ncbi:MAG: hypothetical protein M1838_000671 [Thelocarpon superellum]|nr:MAG: hypothetical protein M1838_000671 [Thelocarpon superellum]
MPAQDSPTPGPRPTYNARTGSTTSLKDRRANGHGPHSLTGTSLSTSHKVGPHRSHSRAHMIGHTRPQQTRVPSYGKNLGKLAKTHQAREGEGEGRATGRHHRRSRSHTPSSSPHTKQMHDALPLRNRSDASLVKHTTAALKKNSSKVSLKRNGSGKDLSKGPKAEKPARRPSSPSRARIKAHRFPSVHFDLGSNGQDDGWTEVSNSESPTVTRPASQASSRAAISGLSQITSHQADTDGKSAGVKNGAPLDPQAITSRLLQRHPRQNAPPQMSTISATGTPLHHSPRSLSHSQSSTLNGTPSTIRGSITTSNGIESPTRRRSSENDRSDDMSTATGRTRSAGVLTDADSLCQSIAGFNTMQASRTQQKLWLQRASSNIEHHQQMRPENGHSHGILGVGVGVGAGDGRDPRMQRQFDRTNNEYLVVRRHRDPLGDALSRLNRMPGTDRQRRIPATNATDGASDGSRLGLSQSMHEPRRRGQEQRR